jgi:hypothetical protein
MIPPPSRWQKVLAQLRQARWLQGVLIAAALAIVGVSIWIGSKKLFSYEPPPEFTQYSEPLADGVPLADFVSGMSIDDALAKLAADKHTPDRSASHKPPSKRYPSRDLDTLAVSFYRHLDQKGHLTLEFFNNRLYEARFAPIDVKAYVPRLRRAEPALKRDRIGKAELVRGSQRIVANVELANTKVGRELNTQPYVIWQDLRLKQQLAQWEENYGVLSVRSEE